MDERIRDRRRSVNRQKGRRRGSLVIVAVFVLAAAVLFLWLRSSDVFAVKRVTATATARVTEQEVSTAVSGAMGMNLLKLSTGDIEEALLKLPYVSSAEVYRAFPDTLEVVLEEYEPMARVRGTGQGIWLVSEDGTVLEKAQAPKGANLPLVYFAAELSPVPGQDLPMALVDALPIVSMLRDEEVGEKVLAVDSITVSENGGLLLGLEGGTELRLGGPQELEQKLKVAAGIVERYLRDGKQVEYIDATVPERVAVKAK